MKNELRALISKAEQLGLSKIDLDNSIEYLEHNEWGLCFDTIIGQMYEFDIKIDSVFYEMVFRIAEKMKLEEEKFSFVRELL